MADEQHGIMIRSIDWREVFPFTHIFRAFRVAVHPSKLILALVALIAIYVGGWALDRIWPDKYRVPAAQAVGFGGMDVDNFRLAATAVEPSNAKRGIFITFFDREVRNVNGVVSGAVSGKWSDIPTYTEDFVLRAPVWLFSNHWVFAILFSVWFLVIWSLFGGAISRIAAVHVARDEKSSVRQALRFSSGKILSFVFAPLIPLMILLLIAVIVAAGGWVLFHIKWIGPVVGGWAFVLPLLAGFVMTLVLIGTVGGLNLMYPTIAVEGSDSFDAISRSFSYVFARPWRMAFYTLVAVVYGAITYLFVRYFIYLVLLLTHLAVTWWFKDGSDVQKYFEVMWPTPQPNSLPHDLDYAHLKPSEDIAATGIAFWVYLLIGLLGAFAISFYFSANTIVYFLMRREVDATDLDDVYAEDSDDEFAADAAIPAGTPSGGATSPESPSSSASPEAPPAGNA